MRENKMYTTLLLGVLPVFAYADIALNIRVSGTTDATVQATGQYETIINADHKELFHLTDQLLRNAVFNLSGQFGEVFLKEPGNDNIYGNLMLEPVKTILKPNGSRVNIKTKEVMLNKLEAFNHDDYAKSQNIILVGNVEDNVTCIWKQKDVFPVKINYNIDVVGLGKGPNWNVKSSFGRDFYKTQTVPVTDASFTVNLGPKTDATAILSATKVTAVIEIVYTANLTGQVLAKLENAYTWEYKNYDIKTLMESAAMPHIVILTKEVIIEFYSDCVIKVYGEDLIAQSGENQCVFTFIDESKNEQQRVNLNSKQYKNLTTANTSAIKSSQGNSAVRTAGTTAVLVTYLLLKILML